MSTAGVASRVVVAGDWWAEPTYAEAGELWLPGQSKLTDADRRLLEEIGSAADKGVIEVPPMPKVAMEALKLVRAPDADIKEIVDCIQRDPAMAATLLRFANAPIHGARCTIDSVGQAATYLGMRRLTTLIMETAMKGATGMVSSKAYSAMEWSYALHAGVIAESLGKLAGLDSDVCYLAGLLHDIGRLPILQELSRRKALPREPDGESSVEIILETLHRGVGLQVARTWDLPPAITDAISAHLSGRLEDEESTAEFQSTKVTEAAGDLCIALGLGRHAHPFSILEAASIRGLGIDEIRMTVWLRDTLPRLMDQATTLL